MPRGKDKHMIGRTSEIKELTDAYASDQSEFVAIYGRRRIGKTFLVNETFGGQYAFQHSGAEKAKTDEQLDYFRQSLSRYGDFKCPRLPNWREAFFELEKLLMHSSAIKKVVFIDEVPWLDTPRSDFLSAFEHFWNGWASLRKDILLVVCGSATSWIIKEILYSRGGLHNRVTRPIHIAPFTLKECEEYAKWKNLAFDRMQIAECYMALGGVAYYWSLMQPNLSAAQNIDRLFFAKDPKLQDEFQRLFASLFRNDKKYIEIVTLLASRRHGMTLSEIKSRIGDQSGRVGQYIKELEACGFIRLNPAVASIKKDAIYQLIDNFTLFHFKFLKDKPRDSDGFWVQNYDTPPVIAWRGLSFERLCFWHIPQIKKALGISGIGANIYSWRAKTDSQDVEDAQIDMLIDRNDRTINICEMKYAPQEYAFTKEESDKLKRRVELFRQASKTRKGLMPTLVSTNGLKRNIHSGIIRAEVTLEDLFTL